MLLQSMAHLGAEHINVTEQLRGFPVVQWLRLHASPAGGRSLIPDHPDPGSFILCCTCGIFPCGLQALDPVCLVVPQHVGS